MIRALLALAAAVVLLGVPIRAAETQPPSPLQRLVDAAEEGAIVRVPKGVHRGGVVIDRPLTLAGEPGAVLDGGGRGDVVVVRAPGVTIRGLTIRGTGKSLDRENAGISVTAARATIEDNVLEDVLFGIYLKNAPESVLRGNVIGGKALEVPRRGDGIRLWYSADCVIEENVVSKSRDAVMWFSPRVRVARNRVSEGRYGLHFMYSDDNVLEDNVLRGNSVGAFLMYSGGLVLRRNVFADNRGPSGYGVGLKDMDGIDATDNMFVDNRVGIYFDNSPSSIDVTQRFEHNLFAYNDVGLAFQPLVKRNAFTGNAFVENVEQVAVLGAGGFDGNDFTVEGRGNYWSDYRGYDVDGDGFGDLPYRAESLFESLIDQEPRLRLFVFSPVQQAIEAASRAFPVVPPRVKLEDTAPLVRVPAVAAAMPRERRARGPIALLALLLAAMPVAAMLVARRGGAGPAPRQDRRGENMGQPVLVIEALTKRFGRHVAVDALSLRVGSGEAVALWGTNGAGKTTAIKCVLGLHRGVGRIAVDGRDVAREGKAARRAIGYVPQELALHADLDVGEALRFYADLKGVPPSGTAASLREVGLGDESGKRVGALSGGMKQRLALAVALLADPPLLLLDEMTSNLDARARHELLDLLVRLKAKGKAIVFTSHRVEEVARLADRVVVLDDGRTRFECGPDELASRLGRRATLKLFVDEPDRDRALASLHAAGLDARSNGAGLLVDVAPDVKARPIALLERADVRVRNFELHGESDEEPARPAAGPEETTP